MPENRKKPLLFEKYPDLEANIPWIKLAPLRTPVKKLTILEKKLGINSLWVKCDNLTSPLYGGNKVRKFEFLLADAKDKGYKKVMTAGGLGSNHCVATATFCNQLNLKPSAVLADQPITSHVRNNLLLDLYFKNEIIYTDEYDKVPRDPNVYYMVPGGSTPLGNLGFVNAALELKNQINNGDIPEPDYLFVASGSSGTAAGLLLGLKIAELKTKLHSIQTSFAPYCSFNAVRRLAKKTWKLLAKYYNSIPKAPIEQLNFNDDYFGGEYGLPTQEAIEAVKLIKETEDITLETTYTGKTFAALLGFVQTNKKKKIKDKTILFWNTYNSRDFSDILTKLDYHDLPQEIHWVFENPLPDFGLEKN
ncbi:MAG: pyridoxal-phosphate dependent enzyme [Promethearchaeota archaeon]|nr:MAG: pyridoxal-phosphate dependent enzyme [Candidatus Lokiarchaeota archaeon]